MSLVPFLFAYLLIGLGFLWAFRGQLSAVPPGDRPFTKLEWATVGAVWPISALVVCAAFICALKRRIK